MAPSDAAPAPAAVGAPGVYAPAIIDFSVLGRAWNILQKQWGACLAVLIVVIMIVGPVEYIAHRVDKRVFPIGSVVAGLFNVWIQIGVTIFFLKAARGAQADLGDIFTGGPFYISFLLAQITVMAIGLGIMVVCTGPGFIAVGLVRLTGQGPGPLLYFGFMLITVGFLIALVPLIILGLMVSQFPYLIIDRNLGPIEAIKESARITKGNRLTLFAIGLLVGIILGFVWGVIFMLTFPATMLGGPFVGLAVLFGGFLALALAAGPYCFLVSPVVYLAITSQPAADQIAPQ